MFPAAERATYRTTNRTHIYSRRPSAQPTEQTIRGTLILGGRTRNVWRNQWEAVFLSAPERATCGATNARPFHSRRLNTQPMSQLIGGGFVLGSWARYLWHNQPGGSFTLGCRARNLWRKQSETVLFSAAERATDGATNRRPFDPRPGC